MYFSICIPAYNRAYSILRTLESVKNQSFNDYEVLIVDDGSTDDTQAVVSAFIQNNELEDKFTYYYKNNGGKHSALNVGIEKASGRFFVILDSDDWLSADALSKLYGYCKQIENDDKFCGVMGRTVDSANGKMIGDLFDLSQPVSSYFDYHFILPSKIYVNDCFEANKTEILKQYRFPEKDGMRFVPEAWMFDQIGVRYNLLLTNEIFRYTEYMSDGMTKDSRFREKNAVGFLYHYISRIENILPKKKLPFKLSVKLKIASWYRYWQCVKYDKEGNGPRIKRVTMLGHFTKFMYPLISRVTKG